MNTAAPEPNIYERLGAMTEELGAVGKDSKNPEFGYSYRGIDDVIDALHPLFGKHGIVVMLDTLDHEERSFQTRKGATWWHTRLHVQYTFTAPDGSSTASTVFGEGDDSGDKSISKAYSAAYKTAMSQIFSIPFGVDSESSHTEEQVAAEPLWRTLGWSSQGEMERADATVRSWVEAAEDTDDFLTWLGNIGITGPDSLTRDRFTTAQEAMENAEEGQQKDSKAEV